MNRSNICQVCGKIKPKKDLIPVSAVRSDIITILLKNHPNWSSEGYICIDDLNEYRYRYIYSLLETERGELTEIEEKVLQSLKDQETLSINVDAEFQTKLSFGERLSDKIASFGGSWQFIIIFGGILFSWILLNSIVLLKKPFDPYPFILLNLVLSTLAALQAPIIMMSQNRQEAKDRSRSEHDYQINLKAELEIRTLHQKIDHLLTHQWERLVQIQQIQLELMNEIQKQKLKS